MTSESPHTERISIPLGTSLFSESVLESLLKNVHASTFPLTSVKLISNEHETDDVLKLRVNPSVYNYVKNNFLTDEILIYLPSSGTLGIFAYDLVLAFKTLASLGIMDDFSKWIAFTHQNIPKLIAREKIESSKQNPEALKVTEEILTALNLLEDVKKNSLLKSVVKDVIGAKSMDPNTIIYRLGIAIYHVKRRTNNAVIEQLEDSGALTLKFLESGITKKYSKEFLEILELPAESRMVTIKILVMLLVAACVYYSETSR